MSLLGQIAPDFSLLDTDRNAVNLASLRGQNVVLAFFPGAFTGVCEKEMCAFRDSLSDFNDLNAKVLGISVDSPFSNGAFSQKNNFNFPILSDYTRSAVNAYGLPFDNFAGMPGYIASNRAVFVVDPTGKIIYEWIAPSLGDEPDYVAVKAALA